MKYSDISPRTIGYADGKFLSRPRVNCVLDQFGQVRPLPKNKTQSIIFRRFNKLDSTPVLLQEGVTPTGKTLTKTDVTATVKQLGDWVGITDVIQDFHEDPVLNEAIGVLGDQQDEMYDKFYAGTLKAGTNVVYANGAARNAVNTPVTSTVLDKAIRVLERQEARRKTKVVKAGVNIGTSPIPPSYIIACHSDLRKDFEAISGWKGVHEYANQDNLLKGEAGSVKQFRVVFDNNLTPWADAGGARGAMISTTGVNADVYPVLVIGEDAYGIVPLAGKGAVETLISNPKAQHGDELAQNGSVGWKGWTTAVILNDLFMVRVEAAVTDL
jgi:N4-gp56 family major capsid protein